VQLQTTGKSLHNKQLQAILNQDTFKTFFTLNSSDSHLKKNFIIFLLYKTTNKTIVTTNNYKRNTIIFYKKFNL